MQTLDKTQWQAVAGGQGSSGNGLSAPSSNGGGNSGNGLSAPSGRGSQADSGSGTGLSGPRRGRR